MGGFLSPLPQAPRMPGPQPGSRGGIVPPSPGLMPFQQNGLAEAMGSIGQLLGGLAKAQEAKKKKAMDEFQNTLQLSQATGIQYDPEHMAKLLKQAGIKVDTNNPLQTIASFVGPPQEAQASQVPQQQNQLTFGNGAGQPDPGTPQSATVGLPDFQRQMMAQVQATPPPTVQINQPGQPPQRNLLQRATDALGFTQPPVGANSPAVQQMRGIQQQMNLGRQTQAMMNSAKAQAELAKAQTEVGTAQQVASLNRALAAYHSGMGADGKPLTADEHSNLGFQLRRTINPVTKKPMLETFESDKFGDLLRIAGDSGQPSAVREAVQQEINYKTGMDAKLKAINDMATDWVNKGVYPSLDVALRNAERSFNGRPLVDKPQVPAALKEQYSKDMEKVLELYPDLGTPKNAQLWHAMVPYIASGNMPFVMATLSNSGLSTSSAIKTDQDRQRLGIEKQNASTAAGGLALRQKEFGYNVAKDQRDFAADQRKQAVEQGFRQLSIIGAIGEKTKDGKLSDEQAQNELQLLQNVGKGPLEFEVGPVMTAPHWYGDKKQPGAKPLGAAPTGQVRPAVKQTAPATTAPAPAMPFRMGAPGSGPMPPALPSIQDELRRQMEQESLNRILGVR